ncbi:PspA/IM30 family protein [Paenibacillus puerhi]|uniref:PspA/IM30 family protein n=1 Tax=Paenibacillus puerhi TaxID=2692622 RepID=UPI001357B410|nr:PspA/IM30 family protein [Paenibacillus puerhi]
MEILSRFRAIMASNIQAILDKADDPEKTIDEFMRSLTSDLGKVKAETASVLADEQRAKRALDECRGEIRKLQSYAEKAVEAGRDEEARKFLERKRPLADKEEKLQASYDLASSNAASMKQLQDKLVADIGKLEARRVVLKGKMAEASFQQKVNASGSSTAGGQNSIFDSMDEKVDRAYHEAMAIAELRAGNKKDDIDELFAQFEKQASNNDPDDELAAIKEKMKKKE